MTRLSVNMVLRNLHTREKKVTPQNAIYYFETATWSSLYFCADTTNNLYFNLKTEKHIVDHIFFLINPGKCKFCNFTKKRKNTKIKITNFGATLTWFCITTPLNSIQYYFRIRLRIYYHTFYSLFHVIWVNINHFISNLPSTSCFKPDYTTGLPEGYIRGGYARPYALQ